MKKNLDGTTSFKSTLRKRMYNRLMSNLKNKGYKLRSVKTKHKGTIRFEAIKDLRRVNVIGIIRASDMYENVAININDYSDITFDDNTFIVLLDRRYLYPMKYNTTKNIQPSMFFFRDYLLIPENILIREL
jgi:hypothetical protein